jgi:hypothetical protein
MKKFFLTMCVALLSMSIQAQEQKHEVGVFYGAGSAFRGFVEAGVGEKGLFCAGLRYKF